MSNINPSPILHDPINLTELAGKADERRAQAAAIKQLGRISWLGFGGMIFTVFFSSVVFIVPRGSFVSTLALAIMAIIGLGSILLVIGGSGTAQHRRLKNSLVLRQEANEYIRRLMPDLPEGHQPLLTQKSRGWYWFYFAGLVVISLAVFVIGLYTTQNISNMIFPAFPTAAFFIIINTPQITLWTIWYDLWMGQSILSIWRWIRYGTEPERGLHCLTHGLSLIILTILPLFLLYLAEQQDIKIASFGWMILMFLWLYQSQFLGKYVIGFPHDWITKPVTKGKMQQAVRRLNFMKGLRPYNPGLHQANAIILSLGGQYMQAEQAYRNILAENPPIENQILCLANLVDALMEQRKYQQAIAVLDVVMYLAPDMSLNYLNLAEIHLLNRSDPARALQILEAGLEQNNTVPVNKQMKVRLEGLLWVEKAWALAELGLHQSAYDALQEGWSPANIKKASQSSQANMHYITGRVYYLENQFPQAIASFLKACEMHPAGAVAQRAQIALNYLQSQSNQEIA